jgi:hypothetical protein
MEERRLTFCKLVFLRPHNLISYHQVCVRPIFARRFTADDTKEPRKPLSCGPVEGRALGIGIYEDNPLPFPGPLAGKMQGERGLADTTLLIEERDDHRSPLAVFHWPQSSPTVGKLDSSKLDSKLGGSQTADLLDENSAPGS